VQGVQGVQGLGQLFSKIKFGLISLVLKGGDPDPAHPAHPAH